MKLKLYHILLLLAFLSPALSAEASSPAEKSAEAARRLIGKAERYADAKNLISAALADSVAARDAETWFIAGTLDWDAFETDMKKLSINPGDKSVNPSQMAEKVFNGYKSMARAIALDTLPNAKGKVKPRFVKKIYPRMAGMLPNIYTSALRFYADGKFYPEAFESLTLCVNLPDAHLAKYGMTPLADSIRGKASYFAGVSAYREKHYREAYEAFTRAAELGRDDDNTLAYRIACLEAGICSEENGEATRRLIASLAEEGFKRYSEVRFGFLDSAIESLHALGENEEALRVISEAEEKHALKPSILALKGWILSELGRDDEAIEIFRSESVMAAPYPDILLEGASKIYKEGIRRYDAAKGRSAAARKAREEARKGYIEPALSLAGHALATAREQGNDAVAVQAEEMVAAIQYTLDSLI